MRNNKVIVVLGSGRSGTSLLMQILHAFGMHVSENCIKSSVANPLGPFEDKEIFDLHSALIHELGVNASIPMPDGWLQDNATLRAANQLEALLQSRLENVNGLFGFKDPKTSMLLPLWVRVFNKLKLIPIYVLAVRDPSATVASFMMQYSQPACMVELVWLARMAETLESSAADCFVVHYEDWFTAPQQLAQDLLNYTGLGQYFEDDLTELLGSYVKQNLNRARINSYQVQNAYVLNLYEVLKQCHGADFDRGRLMAAVKECKQAMDGFKGWYLMAHQLNKKLSEAQKYLHNMSTQAAKVHDLELCIKSLEQDLAKKNQIAAKIQILGRQLQNIELL